MVRATCIALGLALVVLWLIGVTSQSTSWLAWLDGLGALFAFSIATAVKPGTNDRMAVSPAILAGGLFMLWAMALVAHATPWLAWWTFVLACAFLMLGIAGGATTRTTRPFNPSPTRMV